MLRYLLALLILAANLAPAAAVAQTAPAENALSTATTQTTTTNTSQETTNTTGTDPAEGPDRDDPTPSRTGEGTALEASGEALLKLFVLAVILESALALLFNWRPFVAKYDGRGVKAPISLAAALALVFAFKPDSIADLMGGYGAEVKDSGRFFARVVEAMVIAGGSAGVHRLFVALGFRSVTRVQEVMPRPKPTEAWISVGLDRQKAVGEVLVELTVGGGNPTIAGTIAGTRAAKRSYFRRDYGRLPPAGGISVVPGEEVKIRLLDQVNQTSPIWGPYRLAAGAIVDIDLTL